MNTLYFELLCGASGDMILASLIDIGFPVEYLEEQLARLQIEPIRVGVEKIKRNGIMCSYISPEWQSATHYRHIGDILQIIKRGNFSERVMSRCEKILDRLATAEAYVHGISKEHVHFHEIGAVDTIIDIVGVCLALEYLKIDNVLFSDITEGHGLIESEHGTIPVPVPATANMIEGYKIKILDITTEILTPTGAAILTAIGSQVQGNIEGTLKKTGYGCGTKVFPNRPNALRCMLLEHQKEGESFADAVHVLETDMDHISGEIMGHVAHLLIEEGALDVSWIPLYMKKGRPGYRLSVISQVDNSLKLIDLIMVHTRTLGIRVQQVQRVIAMRENVGVDFLGSSVSAKNCRYKSHGFTKIEYESLKELSLQKSIPLLDLIEKYILEKSK